MCQFIILFCDTKTQFGYFTNKSMVNTIEKKFQPSIPTTICCPLCFWRIIFIISVIIKAKISIIILI